MTAIGITFPEPIATILAPLLIFFLSLYVLIHGRRLLRIIDAVGAETVGHFSWIPLYGDKLSRTFTWLTIALLPAVVASSLFYLALSGVLGKVLAALSAIAIWGLLVWIGGAVISNLLRVSGFGTPNLQD